MASLNLLQPNQFPINYEAKSDRYNYETTLIPIKDKRLRFIIASLIRRQSRFMKLDFIYEIPLDMT